MRALVGKKWRVSGWPCAVLAGLSHWIAPDSYAANANLKINATQPGVSGPVCVRAIIRKSDGSYVSGEWDSSSFPGEMRGKAIAPSTIVEIPTGETTITVGKGPDYFPQTITKTLDVPGQTYTVNVVLQPVFDLYRKGWRGGDGHVHYNHGEKQISRTPEQAFALLAAGGMNFASFAEEHYGATTLTRQQMFDAWKPYDNSECKLWLGAEEPKNGWGHHIAILNDPWAVRSAMPYHWGIKTVHDQGGVSYPVHSQRLFPGRFFDDPNTGRRQWFVYPDNNYLKSFPLDALLGNIDGWSGVSDQGHAVGLLDPYFKLLSLGYRIPLLADSDVTMDRVYNGIKSPGCWMSYYQLEGSSLTRASIATAMRKGRVMSTTGPLVLFTIDGAEPGDTLAPNGSARTVRIQASHTFNPWTLAETTFDGSDVCKVSQIDLFRNGEIVQTWNPNAPTADLTYTINESSQNSYYMVRVLGNQNQWMAGYSSPIYFDPTPRSRQPDVYKSLINGRVYDSVTGNNLSASVSCVRYGKTEWTIQTDAKGLFRAYVPLDAELVAKDSSGREFRQDIMRHEPAYAFCHNLSETFQGNMGASVDGFKSIVQEMTWEFPMGFQPAGSYVKTSLSGDATMSGFSVDSAPPPTSGKQNTEIVMIIVDKTRVQVGGRISFAVLFRNPQEQAPIEELAVDWRGWDPAYPRMYTRYEKTFQFNNQPAALLDLGNGFYLRQGAVVVPSWAANRTETTAAIKLHAQVRGSVDSEEACLLLPLGATKSELLVSATWDGFPASWGEIGLGPCNFHRELSAMVRYADYRGISLRLKLNGSPMTIQPFADTAHNADADDAVFTDNFYYDGQCEPPYRNIPFRDNVRGQPGATDFSAVRIQNPSDSGAGGGDSSTASLTVEINGNGTVSPNLNGKNLTVGRSYKFTAKPGTGQIFSGWTGDLSSPDSTMKLTLQGNTQLQANFATNPFAPARGNYAGLFREASAVRPARAGFFTVSLTKSGSFSGRFTVAGKKISARGKFDAAGNAPLALRIGKTNLSGTLKLDLTARPGQISGQVSEGSWLAEMLALQADVSKTNSPGRYTLAFPGSDTDDIPSGDGFGTVVMDSSKKVRFIGRLADGTAVSQAVAISSSGEWPLFASLNRGGGLLMGWLNLQNGSGVDANWIRPSLAAERFYPAGFTNVISVSAAPYDRSAKPVLNLPNGILDFAVGNIESFDVSIQLSAENKFVFDDANANRVSLKLNAATGVFNGQFVHPQTRRITKIRGALLQNQTSGAGYFLETNRSKSVRLRAGQ